MENISIIELNNKYNLCAKEPNISFFIDKINNNEIFSFVRLQIEWWQTLLLGLRKYYPNINVNDLSSHELSIVMLKAWEENCKKRKWHFDSEVFEVLLEMIRNNKPSNFFLAVSLAAVYENYSVNTDDIGQLIKQLLPKNELPFLSTIFRKWVISGQIQEFFDFLKDKHVILIGPPYFRDFGLRLKLKYFYFIEISHINACYYKYNYLHKINKLNRKLGNNKKIFLFYGGSAIIWLIINLHQKINGFLIDVGRAIDIPYFFDKRIRKNYPKWQFGSWLQGVQLQWNYQKYII